MSNTLPGTTKPLLSLKHASQMLRVTVETLLEWNEHNILKPTISQNGEIGYTQQQIDQFLTIQRLIQRDKIMPRIPAAQTSNWQTESLFQNRLSAQANTTPNNPTNLDSNSAPISKPAPKFPSNSFILSFASILILIAIAVSITQGSLKVMLTQQQNPQNGANSSQSVLGTQTSGYGIPQQANFTPSIEPENTSATDKNLQNEGENVLKDKIAPPSAIYAVNTGDSRTLRNQANQMTVTGPTDPNQKTMRPDSNIPVYNSTMSDTSNFDSQNTDSNSTNNSTIDESGNIKGDGVKTQPLATILGSVNTGDGYNSVVQTNDSKKQLIFLVIFIAAVFFVFRKPLAYAIKLPQTSQLESYAIPVAIPSQKILEVDQKTDGTVVLYFKGEEYKISKPELYSDSDQFIGRLMELVQPDTKEIDYNSSNDHKIRLSAPLSRIVTRLGFVGIKRDLFFPRTSKDRVFFRKYLTQEDLTAMNLTRDQILNGLLSTS